jgi:hypothetical protein
MKPLVGMTVASPDNHQGVWPSGDALLLLDDFK